MSRSISIVIPTFNRPKKLARALESCLTQSSPPTEIIVVDNGENPETRPTVDAAKAKANSIPIRYLSSERFDIRKALACGIEAVMGDWVILLDDDDFLVPNRIENDLCILSQTRDEVIGLIQDFLRIDYENELVWEHRMADKSLGLFQALVVDDFPPPPAGTWRSIALKEHHSFHEPDGWMTDFDLYASVLPYGTIERSGQFGYIMDDTRVAGRLTGNIDNAIDMIDLHRERFRKYRRHQNAPDHQIENRLDQQIAFFAGKVLRLKAFFGVTAPYSRKHVIETIKGCISPLRAMLSRLFPNQMPMMRGSKTYSLKRFSKDHLNLSQQIKKSRLPSK
jgi:glycosyltransferase involved in cell wall biosynthesis